ncbi:DUF1453 domain-containing protein [Micromonospora mirobrigensis]|uniref:DUF1453 domain-containing protein n=1 Tax=Micromonospora mirobrigensis TaxID=262898 RepID=A0A1C5ALR7_9ACTN|nr:DUF1453 domain-containing protein [Micromonospora mirobrigensis]SCF46149.1 hypothetical protein GA0070564_11312 [Micromonospora mirobrigensis]
MNLTTMGVALLLIGYVLVRRLAGEPLAARRLVVLPAALVVWGAVSLTGALAAASRLDLAVLALEAGIAVLTGLGRGATVAIHSRDGHLWYRYRPITVAVWLGLLLTRAGITLVAHRAGAQPAVLHLALPLMFGLSLVAESAVVGRRALRSGLPWAPRRGRRTRLVPANRPV